MLAHKTSIKELENEISFFSWLHWNGTRREILEIIQIYGDSKMRMSEEKSTYLETNENGNIY